MSPGAFGAEPELPGPVETGSQVEWLLTGAGCRSAYGLDCQQAVTTDSVGELTSHFSP